jgi:hypothetical protein
VVQLFRSDYHPYDSRIVAPSAIMARAGGSAR